MTLPPAPLGRLIVAASVVGVLAAAVAVAVRFVLGRGLNLIYGATDAVSALEALPAPLRIVAPMLGGLAAGSIAALFARRGAQGGWMCHGGGGARARAAERRAPSARRSARSRRRSAAARSAARVPSSSSAPASATSWQRAGISLAERRALVAAGTAAGFAAAYNTPIAAVLFVLEVVLGVATLEVLIPVAVATASASFDLRHHRRRADLWRPRLSSWRRAGR
ncbi:MAG: chloride channel protein [Myxococcota bacterium]